MSQPPADPRAPANHPSLDPRTPVVVGVGQASERLGEPGYRQRSPVDLAADAAADALADTGADPPRSRRRSTGGRRHPPVREFPSAGAGTAGPFG